MKFRSFVKRLLSQGFIRNSGIQFIERIVNMFLAFISSVFVIRYFLPAEYGVFAYANSYISLFSVFTTLGVGSIVVRELVNKGVVENDLMGSAFILMLSGSFLATILVVITSFHGNNHITNMVILIFCISTIVSSLSVVNFYFQAKVKTNVIAIVMLFQDFYDFGSKLLLIHFKASLLLFAMFNVLGSCLLYITIYKIYRHQNKINWKIKISTIKYLLQHSIPLALSGLMINLYMRLDQVMLKNYSGLQSVAEYSVGIRLLEVVYILPMIVAPNIFPSLINKFNESKDDFDKLFTKLLCYYIYTGVGLTLFIFILAPTIVTLLYGSRYENAGNVLRYASICIVPVFVGVISSLWLQINMLQKKQLYQTFLGFIVCIGLNFILIPRFNEMGAVFSLVVAQLITGIFSVLFYRDLRHLFRYYLKALDFRLLKA